MIRSIALCLVLLIGACSQPTDRVIVAAGTTLVDSGVIDFVAERFEATHSGVQLSIVGESTGLILELGSQGAADVLLVHAPEQEKGFVASGRSSWHHGVMDSRFILIGPADLKPEFAGLSPDLAFSLVATREQSFMSRGDHSGTHDKELSLWADIGVDPTKFRWYVETGQGMGPTIQVADQRGAVTLAEYGAFLAATDAISIVDLGLAQIGLSNPYTGYVVEGTTQESQARLFLEWLVSAAGREAIIDANFELFGEVVYQPVGSG